MKRIYLSLILLLLVPYPARATILQSGTFEAVKAENQPEFVEMFRIQIQNIASGEVSVSTDEGNSWQRSGTVIRPVNGVSNAGYTASKWVANGTVAAVAVNAIHIKTDYNFADDKGVIFSIIPRELNKVPVYYNSYTSPDSSIYTDIAAGEGIFGGGFSPYVGNKVFLEKAGKLVEIGTGYVPTIGDTIIIQVLRPKRYPKEVVFENRFGGMVTLMYPGGQEKIIGVVLKPVLGVGRFQGSQYAGVGRIRANHSAVICVSTSPVGETGGFQIIPSAHGMSSEMVLARTMTQWMVVGPPNVTDPSPEGVAPLFQYFINPSYRIDDLDKEDWGDKLLSRFLVDVKIQGDDSWRPMPIYTLDPDLRKPLPNWANRALEKVTSIRILFPVYKDEK